MRTCLALVIVFAACGSNSTSPGSGGVISARSAGLEAPAVAAAGVVATDDTPPPVLILIDSNGHRSVAAAASWLALAAGTFSAGPKPAGDNASFMQIKEGTLLGKDPKAIVDAFTDFRTAEDLGRMPTGETDDPPPPEEEDDESGGSGTAMALEEGKMGRKDSGKARGPRWANVDGDTEVLRQASAVGEVTNAKMTGVPAVVIPHPSAKAAAVIKAVSELEAMIGVKSGGAIRPLRIQFQRDRETGGSVESDHWLEVRLESSGLTIEAVPSKSITVAWGDAGQLKAALAQARDRRKFDPRVPVDVLVAADVDAQHLVDILVALDGAGVLTIGLGLAPTDKQIALRGHEPEPPPKGTNRGVPTVSIGSPNTQGDLDKDIIRRYIKRNIHKIQYCYEKELLAKPKLRGTIQIQFFITPDGKVATSTGSGVDPEVANCVAAVVKDIEFPKPKGGGGVQVNYPFTFKQDGDK